MLPALRLPPLGALGGGTLSIFPARRLETRCPREPVTIAVHTARDVHLVVDGSVLLSCPPTVAGPGGCGRAAWGGGATGSKCVLLLETTPGVGFHVGFHAVAV